MNSEKSDTLELGTRKPNTEERRPAESAAKGEPHEAGATDEPNRPDKSKVTEDSSAANASAPSDDSATAGRPRLQDVPRSVLLLAALLVVLVVTAATFGYQAFSGYRLNTDRAEALAAARQAAANLTSFNFDSATSDTQRLSSIATPNFERSFAPNEAAFTQMLQASKLKVTGDVTGAGLYGYSDQETHALIAIKAQVQNAETPNAQERDYRMDLTMVRQNGRWLVDSAQFIS